MCIIKCTYAKVIENEVLGFYNLFDPNDKGLLDMFTKVEYDNALGLKGVQIRITLLSKIVIFLFFLVTFKPYR